MGKARSKTRVAIIGAGFGGIGLGIKLRQAGLSDFVILEKSNSVGGVWRDNHYPGAACDVPSHLYSFSFEPKADWPKKFAGQSDIFNYLKHCARKHGLTRHIRLNTEVTAARWDEAAKAWILRIANGEMIEAQALVTATGQLSRPQMPSLPGLKNFAGKVFHSAQWPRDYDLAGKRVAVIGTGASAIQFVPAIAPRVRHLTLFQRSAAFVLPKPDRAYTAREKWLFAHVPGLLKLSRLMTYLHREATGFPFVTWRAAMNFKRYAFRRFLKRSIPDEDLRKRLTPDYRMGCKRILLSNDFYPALNRTNVAVVTEHIDKITPHAIVDEDGVAHKIDCIIFGTGFAASEFLAPIKINGAGGRDLHTIWRRGARAYLGTTVAGFPNFFMLYGPNTNLAHNSIVYMVEKQIRYVIACLKRLGGGIGRLEVKKAAQDRYNARLQRRLKKALWSTDCTNWYVRRNGINTANWPGYTFEFNWRTRKPDWDDYAAR